MGVAVGVLVGCPVGARVGLECVAWRMIVHVRGSVYMSSTEEGYAYYLAVKGESVHEEPPRSRADNLAPSVE